MSEKEKRNNQPVFVDFEKLNEQQVTVLGRELTDQEKKVVNMADAIKIDALACGRTVIETVSNIEKYGGEVSDAVKAYLGLTSSAN
jgi:hypothetical protein